MKLKFTSFLIQVKWIAQARQKKTREIHLISLVLKINYICVRNIFKTNLVHTSKLTNIIHYQFIYSVATDFMMTSYNFEIRITYL